MQLRTAVHGHASHALGDVIRKSRLAYRGKAETEVRPPTRQSEFFLLCIPVRLLAIPWRILFYSIHHSMCMRGKLRVVSDWLINVSFKFYSRIATPFEKGGAIVEKIRIGSFQQFSPCYLIENRHPFCAILYPDITWPTV